MEMSPLSPCGKRFEGDDNQLSRDNLVKRWDDFCDGIRVSCEHGCDVYDVMCECVMCECVMEFKLFIFSFVLFLFSPATGTGIRHTKILSNVPVSHHRLDIQMTRSLPLG